MDQSIITACLIEKDCGSFRENSAHNADFADSAYL
jgi:hypothetical protein